ncbi:hypothetical protein VPNG_09068 [Cytospora leucostoma]|uniref:tyrosinase n=1 Tax=Cytospora leucostoma TaxID=1230097 RepID=A0A423VZF3_9PEZI|nr:hypothetical protein VPNG_09068 [Cytospora leucostoma]
MVNGKSSVLLPTFKTIQESFNNITSTLGPEDVFYFHFSGHRALLTRTSKSPPDHDNDASLMPADYCRKQAALRGWQLNNWLEELNKRKVHVVVSLDSCYSGASWRTDDTADARTPVDWPEVANLPIDEEAVKDEKPSGIKISANRDIKFCDKHIMSTDSEYKPPHPESYPESHPADKQPSKTPIKPVTPDTSTAPQPHSTPKKEPGRGQSPSARDGNAYGITGIPKSLNENIPVRKDVDEWYHEQTTTGGGRIQPTLFTEALAEIQQRPLTADTSYFRLAGIHAATYAGWDGFDNPKEQKDRSFCVHNDSTFPTWHRVYVTLFEQVVYEAMIKFIDAASDVTPEMRSDWREEAERWRLPYWDFARFATHGNTASEELRLPILATLPTVMVRVFGSVERLVSKPKPLYRFQTQTQMGDLEPPYAISSVRAKENDEEVEFTFDKCFSTTKYGLLDGYRADIWADGGQNRLRANLALNKHPWYQNLDIWDSIPTLQDMTYRLLKSQDASWGAFATTKYEEEVKDPKAYALGGRPFQINVFFGPVDGKDFYDSKFKSFVGSVFNVSGDVKDSQYSNCTKQQEDGVMSVSQLPATLAMNYAKLQSSMCPQVSYVVMNSQGRSEQEVDVEVKLHRAKQMFYEPQ